MYNRQYIGAVLHQKKENLRSKASQFFRSSIRVASEALRTTRDERIETDAESKEKRS